MPLRQSIKTWHMVEKLTGVGWTCLIKLVLMMRVLICSCAVFVTFKLDLNEENPMFASSGMLYVQPVDPSESGVGHGLATFGFEAHEEDSA